jgi:glycosyltransferase involved in cell wall biosynthesis
MEGTIRVAQVVTRFIAGAGGVALRGALALDPDHVETAIVAGTGGTLLDDAERVGFEVTRVSSLVPELDIRRDPAALRELTEILGDGRFDVVHTHSAKAGALGRIAARLAGVPAVVHTYHGFPFHEFQSRARRAAYVQAERSLARITDQFLVVGSAVAAEAIRRGIVPVDRVRVIDSAIADGIPVCSRESRYRARAHLSVPPGMYVVGNVGRLDEQKAPLDFVAAIAELDRPDVMGVMIGDGPLREQVARDIAVRGLTDRIVLLGERRDVPECLPAFDVFAMSSLYEGVPCAIVEAMRCGIPVAATAVNSVPEIVVPGRTGLLAAPTDPVGLATAIRYLLDHPADAQRMACSARTALVSRFSPEGLAEDLMATYLRALGEPAQVPVPVTRPRALARHGAAVGLALTRVWT